jgi:hypothetical protein
MKQGKIRLLLNWLSAVAFLALTCFKVIDYIETKENWPLFASIVFGLLTIIKFTDLVIFYRQKRKERAGLRI